MDSQMMLGAQGVFAENMPDFVARSAQQEMADAVELALKSDGCLVAESGTGTGKTFAYLVPLMLSGKKAIISTATKHLQEQIYLRDLPAVAKLINPYVKTPIKAVLLKGRANYLCRHHLEHYQSQSDLIGRSNNHDYRIISDWAATTTSGDIAEVEGLGEDAKIWKQLTSTADNCLGGKCPKYSRCFVNKARQNALKADIVVVNHHLFFSDLTLKTDGFGELLPEHDAVIFDEAHNISEVAALFFGFSISSFQLKELIADVLAAEKKEASSVHFASVLPMLESAIQAMHSHVDRSGGRAMGIDELQGAQFDRLINDVFACLDQLERLLDQASIAGEELNQCHDRCLTFQHHLDEWIEGRDRELIRWVESGTRFFRLVATPLSVRSRFQTMMNGNKAAWVFTSATLAVGEDFSAFCDELGLQNPDIRQWDSPYDFAKNGLIFLPPNMPDPRDQRFSFELTEYILELTALSSGRAFCLFTSYAMMEKVRQGLKGRIAFPVLVQGDSPKQQLIQAFVESDNAVLLGTSSFWEGVDVKGQSLSCVIIDKLPFASPADPVVKSKLSAYEDQGRNPFMELQIPNAVIALKQGVGRLIRSEVDYGVLAICDPRIRTKRYGQTFIESLPGMPISQSLNDVSRFFAEFSR